MISVRKGGRKNSVSFKARWIMVSGALLVMAIALIVRAADIQLINADFYKRQAEARFVRQVPAPAYRGLIKDRNGRLLAGSAPVYSLWIDPQEIVGDRDGAQRISRALGKPLADIESLVARNARKRFAYVPGFRRQSPRVVDNVIDQKIKGLYSQREFKRFYPQADVFSQVIGLTDGEMQGREGLELAFNDILTGTGGYTRVIMNRHGRPVELLGEGQPATPGEDVTLSLDASLQAIVYRELGESVREAGAESGSAVVLDVSTAEVLAMANWPSYNNNMLSDLTSDLRRNRAVTDVAEPASTMKTFTVLSALELGIIDTATEFDTHPGWIKNGAFTTKDYRNLGTLSTRGVLQKSSNVGVSLIVRQLTREQFHSSLTSFGFGKSTGSGFPGERGGSLRMPTIWSGSDQQTMSYGYGLSVTALQLASAYATLANEGVRIRPSFIKGGSGEQRRVVSARSANAVLDMLQSVTERGGTATRAHIDGYRVAGKTGTARKAARGGYERKYVALFAGVVPVRTPRYAVVVVIDNPDVRKGYAGGRVAAPAFRRIMTRVLTISTAAPDAREQ